MRKIITTTMLLACFLTCTAQDYSVFALKGCAYMIQDEKRNELSLGEIVSLETKIIVPANSKILFLDLKKKKKMPMITGPADGSVRHLLKKKDAVGFIKCSKEVISYIFGRNSNDFGSEDNNGKFIINARSQRSLAGNKNHEVSELDKEVIRIMTIFNEDNKPDKECHNY